VVPNYNANLSGLHTANGAASPGSAPFTDNPLISGSSVIRAVHITELRSRISAVRAAKGLGAFSWTDPTLTPASSVIKAVHITDLRAALAQAYTASGSPLPTYTDPSLSGVNAKVVHIAQLRTAVIAIE
jgi:hypothetical protein